MNRTVIEVSEFEGFGACAGAGKAAEPETCESAIAAAVNQGTNIFVVVGEREGGWGEKKR